MPQYQVELTAAGNKRYRVVMTDHQTGWQHVFDDVSQEIVKRKKVYIGKENGPHGIWTAVVSKQGDFYRIDVTDYRFFVIRFDECEQDELDGQTCIVGWAEQASFLEEIKEAVAA